MAARKRTQVAVAEMELGILAVSKREHIKEGMSGKGEMCAKKNKGGRKGKAEKEK